MTLYGKCHFFNDKTSLNMEEIKKLIIITLKTFAVSYLFFTVMIDLILRQ